MKCAWQELLAVVPRWMVSELELIGPEELSEIRMRENCGAEFVLKSRSQWTSRKIINADIQYCMNAATRFSPWSSSTIGDGYLTIRGGHRIGICGDVVCKDKQSGILRSVSSLCIRVAKDLDVLRPEDKTLTGSVLILGPPGWGKSTLLRDLARSVAFRYTVCVADEREELFPDGALRGAKMDVLRGCPKAAAIDRLLRTMSPQYIAVDEITSQADSEAILRAQGCGAYLLATAHAESIDDMKRRPAYRPLLESQVFTTILLLQPDKTYRKEKAGRWTTNG